MKTTMKAFAGLSLLGLASAQTSVVSVFLGPGFEASSLVGSIVGSDSTATTYSLTCPPSPDDCGMGPGLVVTNGPKTAAWTMDNLGDDFTGVMQCDVTGTTSAVCTRSFGGSDANFPGSSVQTMNKDQMDYIPASITAGVITKATGSTATATTASATAAGTGTTTGQDSASTTTAEESTDEASTSTGGLPKVTGSGWAVGGLAVALAAAVI